MYSTAFLWEWEIYRFNHNIKFRGEPRECGFVIYSFCYSLYLLSHLFDLTVSGLWNGVSILAK